LQPSCRITNSITFWNVTKIFPNFRWQFFKLLSTAATRSSTVLCCCLCWRAWMAAKYPRSRTFKSGELGGWLKRPTLPVMVLMCCNS
jgi:hypothetical protein